MLDYQKMESIVNQACYKWSYHRDIDDLKQIGRIAYWKENCSDDPDPLAITKVRRRVIDGWRSMNGSSRHKHGILHGNLGGEEDILLELEPSSEDQFISKEAIKIFDKKKSIIANLLINGYTKQYIADYLKVHPSRITQIVIEMRKQTALDWINA